MITESQKQASIRYHKKNIVNLIIGLNRKTDADLLDFLSTQPNKAGLVKKLLRKEMNRSQ